MGRKRVAPCQMLMNYQRNCDQGDLWRRASPRPDWIYVQEGCKLLRGAVILVLRTDPQLCPTSR